MIDYTRFCADENEPRKNLQKPWRSAGGIVYCNGQILVCVPDDGLEYATEIPGMGDSLSRFARESPATGKPVDMQALVLPAINLCQVCKGDGRVQKQDCKNCKGLGEFIRNRQVYECRDCDGRGYGTVAVRRGQTLIAGTLSPCKECDGRGEFSQSVALGNAFFARHYLAMIAVLPGCNLWPHGTTKGSAFTFDGGYGWLMPCSS